MDKYAQRVMEEVYHTFSNHYKDIDERVEFLTDLIETLQNELQTVNDSLECGICDEGKCDCEPETGPGY